MSQLLGQYVGRYHIVEKLGAGGMATVYKAFDSRLERDVAIKFIRPEVVRDEMFIRRFEREAKALARLSHPNIVKVLDYGEHENMPYIVMEYLRGDTLKGKLGRPMPWKDAARLLLPVAEALDYTHRQNIIHRDVKPSNFLVSDSGHLLLSDFGIAKMLDTPDAAQLTGTGVGIGTPEYMAPEQGLGHAVDQRADVYSLGIVFFEMVTGQKPYSADTPMAVMYKQISDPLPQPRGFVPSLPQSVERVLFKALAKKPEDRYQDMAAFAKALQDLIETAEHSDSVGTRVVAPDTLQMETRVRDISQPISAIQSQQQNLPPDSSAEPSWMQQSAVPEKKKKSTPIWITCGVLLVVGLCVGIVAVTGGFGALVALFGTPPDGLAADVFVPSTVEMGREFQVTVTLRNNGDKDIQVNQIQVPRSLLSVATLNRTTPQYSDSINYDITESTGFDFDIPLAPGASQEVLFHFTPLQTADVSGDWDVRVGTRSLKSSLRVVIVEQVAQAPTSTTAPPINTMAPSTATQPVSPATAEPTRTPETVSEWTLLWEDDFSDPESGFYVGENEDRAFWYENETYKIEGIKSNWIVWVYLGYTLNNMQVQIDAQIENGTGATAYGLFCRYQGEDGDFYGFEVSEDGYYTIWLRYNEEYTDLVAWTYDNRLEGYDWRKMTIECDGDRLSLLMDGELLSEVTDSTLTFGDVGLMVESDEQGGSIVMFDNFALYEK